MTAPSTVRFKFHAFRRRSIGLAAWHVKYTFLYLYIYLYLYLLLYTYITITVYTPWKTNMEPDNPWLVEENSLPWDHCQGLC